MAGPRAEGVVRITSQTFCRKNETETVEDSRSRRCMTYEKQSMSCGLEDALSLTLSKNSPVVSSKPGSSARMNDFMTGRSPCLRGK